MIYKRIYFVLLYFITLSGCGNSQNEISDKDFKNYFFQPDWFNEPKVYEYEFNSTAKGEKYYVYRYFEKIDNDQIKHIIYDKDFNQTVIIIYKYLPNQVIIKEATTIETWNNNRHIQEKVTENVVFDYHKMNEDFGFSHTARDEGYSDVTKYVTRNLKRLEKREFDGKEVDVVVADGKTDIDIKTDSEDVKLHYDEMLIYAENVGVIYQESKNQYGKVIVNLVRILSKNEFESMKNAR